MISYLIVYILGVVTPITVKKFVVPEVKKWLKNKTKEWK